MADSKENDISSSETGYGHPPVNSRFKRGSPVILRAALREAAVLPQFSIVRSGSV